MPSSDDGRRPEPSRPDGLREEDRIPIADRVREKVSIRGIARQPGRAPSAVSREVRRRNRHPAGGRCRPRAAQARTDARRPGRTVHTRGGLDAVAAESNAGPRRTLGRETPAERLVMLLATASRSTVLRRSLEYADPGVLSVCPPVSAGRRRPARRPPGTRRGRSRRPPARCRRT
ncbi:helix-turn-helix domain-containing protein [Planomonospora sp. ID67723]|uniref:helix-turn-helix domain-containing protein n=1 Tax=Planomonospora sp. ID67723 TaxID=2738134 RepID=UPI0035A85FB4